RGADPKRDDARFCTRINEEMRRQVVAEQARQQCDETSGGSPSLRGHERADEECSNQPGATSVCQAVPGTRKVRLPDESQHADQKPKRDGHCQIAPPRPVSLPTFHGGRILAVLQMRLTGRFWHVSLPTVVPDVASLVVQVDQERPRKTKKDQERPND